MWRIVMTGEVRAWLHALRRADRETLRLVSDALDLLAAEGPTLGRPLVDRVKGSTLHHLIDPRSDAVLLVAGDKSGQWRRWYDKAIPVAEERYAAWIEEFGS